MFGMAVLALASCSKSSDVYDPTASKDRVQYEQAFINAFGTPASNQDWGFGTSSYTRATTATRAAVANPSVTEVGQTYNSFMAESYASAMELAANWVAAGWRSSINRDDSRYVDAKPWDESDWSDRYYQISASVLPSNIDADLQAAYNAAVLEQVPESQNNISKAQSTGYSLTTKGGPVTVTPIYHNSNSDDKVSYYYYPAGTTPNVKSLPKYTIGQLGNDGAMLQSYSLVYVDGSGNVSYDFPANYVICFMVANMSGAGNNVSVLTKGAGDYDEVTKYYANAPEYYGDGNYNQEIHTVQGWNYTPVTTPHAATFSASNVSFVGFEDWNDMDYNDLIFAVGGTTGGGNITIPDGDDDDEEFKADVRIMAEDLNASEKSDFDFNDVVFDVQWITGGAKIRIMAAGGKYPLRINGEDALEVHGLFNVSTKTFVNTISGQKTRYASVIKTITGNFINSSTNENDASLIKVEVNKGTGYIELTAPTGKVASKICVDPKVDWCDEYQDIDKKWNGNFTKYVGGKITKFWN